MKIESDGNSISVKNNYKTQKKKKKKKKQIL